MRVLPFLRCWIFASSFRVLLFSERGRQVAVARFVLQHRAFRYLSPRKIKSFEEFVVVNDGVWRFVSLLGF